MLSICIPTSSPTNQGQGKYQTHYLRESRFETKLYESVQECQAAMHKQEEIKFAQNGVRMKEHGKMDNKNKM